MKAAVQVVRLDAVDGLAKEGGPRWHMIRSALGIESFGINAWRGHRGRPEHNLACAESRDDRAEDALRHLGEAVQLEPRFADNARDDADFDAIRGDSRWPG